MPSINSLLPKLKQDFPEISFAESEAFSWSPGQKTVFYNASEPDATSLLLHELSHSVLNHHDYSQDISLLNMEASAWDKAIELAKIYHTEIHNDTLEGHLDTYRDWMHARSTCPQCQATGHQVNKNSYHCVACDHTWRVNEARICALRRYS